MDNNKEKDFEMSNKGDIIELSSPPLKTESVYIIRTEVGPKEVTVNGEKVKWEWDNAYGTVIIYLRGSTGNKIQINL